MANEFRIKNGFESQDNSNITGSLTVSAGITGSLFGTASFATTASFLNSTTNAFVQGGNSFGTAAILGTNDTQNLNIETAGSTRVFVSSSGQVGIGTTTPYAKLDIIPLDGVDGILLNTSPISSSQSARLMFGSATTASNTPMIFASSGNLQFHTGGTPHVSSGTTKLFISSSGNIGIGTSNPTLGTLQVNGNVYANSFTGSLFGTSSWAQNATNATYTKTTTNITAAQITGSLSVGGLVQVLGAPSTGNYYDWHAFIKFNSGSVAYNNGGAGEWYLSQGGVDIAGGFNLNAVTTNQTWKAFEGGNSYSNYGPDGWQTGSISIGVGAALTSGNGTITVDMYSRELPR